MNNERVDIVNSALESRGFIKEGEIFTLKSGKKSERAVVVDLSEFYGDQLEKLLDYLLLFRQKCSIFACNLEKTELSLSAQNTLIISKQAGSEGVVVNQISGKCALRLEFPKRDENLSCYLNEMEDLIDYSKFNLKFDKEKAQITAHYSDANAFEGVVMELTRRTLKLDEKYGQLCMLRAEKFSLPTCSDLRMVDFLVKNQVNTTLIITNHQKYFSIEGKLAVLLYDESCNRALRAFMEGYNG